MVRVSDIDVIAPNLKRRHSGVTSTIVQLVPKQAEEIGIAALGPGLPKGLPKIAWWQVPLLLRRPRERRFRIWHARRNIDMLAGLALRRIVRAPIKLVFTSAKQRRHSLTSRFLASRMDSVIATSERSGQYLTVPYTVVMHGVDCARFRPPVDGEDRWEHTGLPGRHAIGCFGRIRHLKGTDLFIDAMVRLLPEYPDWTAIVAGRVTRRHRAFQNAIETSPAFLATTLAAILAGGTPLLVNIFASLFIVSRVAMAYVHVKTEIQPLRSALFGFGWLMIIFQALTALWAAF